MHEVVRAVDLFAGFGGMTLGAAQAGVHVVWAANHWRVAVETHAKNHPDTEHVCQDLRQADWTQLPDYDILLAGPSCQGHSSASQPRRRRYHNAMRATAWAVVDCADMTGPRAIVVENVPAFRRWKLYPTWKQALTELGYTLTEELVCASYLGVPQRRTRVIIVATRAKAADLSTQTIEETPFSTCIEEDASGWKQIKDCAYPGARARMRNVARKLGRGLVHHVTDCPMGSLDEPIRTITTKDQWGLVDGKYYRPLTLREYARGMGFPDAYEWSTTTRTETVKGLGNAIPPAMAQHAIERALEAA